MALSRPRPTLLRRILGAAKPLVLHPLGHFALFILFLYQVKEFYPFTHIPMYSNPESDAPYLYLADGDGKALGVKTHSGITNPKMRKMYRKRLDIYCEANSYDHSHPPQEVIDTVGADVIAFLREHAIARKQPLPDTIRLMHVLIEPAPAPDGFKETVTLLTQSTAP